MTAAEEFDQLATQRVVKNLHALFSVLFFVVGNEHDETAKPCTVLSEIGRNHGSTC